MSERPKVKSEMRARQALVTEVLGLALLSVGLGTLRLWLGLAVAGMALVLLGLALERA